MDNASWADSRVKLQTVGDIFDDLVERQCGVARRGQLVAAGATPSRIRNQLQSGRWQALGATVIVTHNGPLNDQQRGWAAALAAGPAAYLGGLSALKPLGMRGWETPEVHVLTPRASTRSVLKGVAVVRHETRRPPERDLLRPHWPRLVTAERAAVDAASWRRDTRSGTAILAAVVQQRLTTAERLRRELLDAGAVRHHRALRLAIEDIAGGAEALSEIDFGQLCHDFDLGVLVRQVMRRDARGLRRYLDGEIVGKTGKRVAFEVDGSVHLLPQSYWKDMQRQNELLIAGVPLLRFSSYAARFQRAACADQIRRALEA